MTTLRDLIEHGTQRLAGSSGTPRLDAEVLLIEVAKVTKLDLVARRERHLTPQEEEQFERALERRAAGEPVAYIIGKKEFFGLDFSVTPAVLVPRPETETLVEEAIDLADDRSGALEILDLGTGSGCIAVALAAALKRDGRDFSVTAVEISAAAIAVAHENIARYGLESEIELRSGDWFEGVPPAARYDFILSNPPYVEQGDVRVSPELRYEPPQALYAPEGGLQMIRRLIEAAPVYLKSGGVFLCEIGAGQSTELARWLASSDALNTWEEPRFIPDLAGIDRVLVLRKAA